MPLLRADFAIRRSPVWLVIPCLLAAALPSFGKAPPLPSIKFMGQLYSLGKVEKINDGNALYFAPSQQNPDQSTDEIIINFYEHQDKNDNVITPEGLSNAMLAQAKAEGATVIMP